MDIRKLIVEEKIEAAGVEQKHQYLVEGSVAGCELPGPVPCVLDSETGDQCHITIADGPDTGASATVSKRDLRPLDEKSLNDAANQLFK